MSSTHSGEIKNDYGNPVPVSGTVTIVPSGTQDVNIVSTITLPVSGPLTDTELRASPVEVDGSGVTQPISAVSLPLPTGASTAALQTTGNTSLSSIDGKLNSLGQKVSASSVPVVLASDSAILENTSLSSKLRIEPQFTAIAIPSTVTYTTLYTYSGTGLLLGFSAEFSASRAVVRLEIDGETVMDGNDTATLNTLNSLGYIVSRNQSGSGIITQASTIDVSFKWPIKFNTSVTISARLSSGASLNYQRGIVYIQKN